MGAFAQLQGQLQLLLLRSSEALCLPVNLMLMLMLMLRSGRPCLVVHSASLPTKVTWHWMALTCTSGTLAQGLIRTFPPLTAT